MLIAAPANAAEPGSGNSGIGGDTGTWAGSTETTYKPGTQGHKSKSAEGAELVATNWVNPCPNGESGVEIVAGYQPQDLGEKGIWAYRASRCDPNSGWVTAFVCIYNCPAGTPTYIPPTPPSWAVVRAQLFQYAPDPQMQFAPPVETNANIGAIVGKRLYVNLATDSYKAFEVTSYDTSGKFFARAYFHPVAFRFFNDDDSSNWCDGPGPSGRNPAGRTELDRTGCFILINKRPPDSHTTVRAVTSWRITIVSNNPNVPKTDTGQTTNTFNVHVKELQAVIVK
jgi:hypothetical protein